MVIYNNQLSIPYRILTAMLTHGRGVSPATLSIPYRILTERISWSKRNRLITFNSLPDSHTDGAGMAGYTCTILSIPYRILTSLTEASSALSRILSIPYRILTGNPLTVK